MKRAALTLLLLAPAVRAAYIEPGASATVGSAGYWKLAASVDAGWKEKELDPYVWAEFSRDRDQRKVSGVLGASKDAAKDLTLHGGLGFAVGKLQDADRTSGSFLLEAGVMHAMGPDAVGGDYRLSAGTITGATQSRAITRELIRDANKGPGSGRSRPAPGAGAYEPQTQTYHEVSGFYRFDGYGLRWTPRLTLGLPSYASPVYTGSLTARKDLGDSLSVSGTLSGDVGSTRGVYFTAGASYSFD